MKAWAYVYDAPRPVLSRTQSLNRYAYLMNKPTTFTDPLGLNCRLTDTCGRGGGAGYNDAYGYNPPCYLDSTSISCGALDRAIAAGITCFGSCSSPVVGSNGLTYQIVQTAGATVYVAPNGEELSDASIAELGLASPDGGDQPTVTPASYQGVFNQGYQAALKDLKRKKCGNFYGGAGPALMKLTWYRFLNLNNPTVGAATPPGAPPTSVFINSTGPYMTYSPVPGNPGPFGLFWTQSQFRAFILLHELGHQLSAVTDFMPDAGNPSLNEQQSMAVIGACIP